MAEHDPDTMLMAVTISFFPIAVSVGIGLSTLAPDDRDILRSLDASKLTIFCRIALPETLPELFGALTVAVTLAFSASPSSRSSVRTAAAWVRCFIRGAPAPTIR